MYEYEGDPSRNSQFRRRLLSSDTNSDEDLGLADSPRKAELSAVAIPMNRVLPEIHESGPRTMESSKGSDASKTHHLILPPIQDTCCPRRCRKVFKRIDCGWLKRETFVWVTGGVCALIALGLGSGETPIMLDPFGRGDDLFYLLAIGCGLSTIGRIINWILFRPLYYCSGPGKLLTINVVACLARLCMAGMRDTFVYYVSSFDGVLGHILWIVGTVGLHIMLSSFVIL